MPLSYFGEAVAGTLGVEVGQDPRFPLARGPTQPCDLGDGTGRQTLDEAAALLGAVLVEDVPDILCAQVDDFNTDVCRVCLERSRNALALTSGEPIARGAHDVADLIQGPPLCTRRPRVSCWFRRRAPPGASPASFGDKECTRYAGGVLELFIDRILVPLKRSRAPHSQRLRGTTLRARPASSGGPCHQPGTRSSNLAAG